MKTLLACTRGTTTESSARTPPIDGVVGNGTGPPQPSAHTRKEWDDDRLNVKVTQEAQAIVTAFGALHDKELIPDEALVDLSYRFYRFAGELGGRG